MPTPTETADESVAYALRETAVALLGTYERPEQLASVLEAVDELDAVLDSVGSTQPRTPLIAIPEV
jgi:hypothetical protein